MENVYMPKIATIRDISDELADVKSFNVRLRDQNEQENFKFRSGQFLEVSAFGVGEAPISISSSPSRHGSFTLTVKAVGSVTNALHAMNPGDEIGIRGPYGNGFPFEEVQGKDVLFVAGGIGLAPLSSLLVNMLDHRSDFRRITLLYGARNPSELLYKESLTEWDSLEGLDLLTTVDVGDDDWQGNVGVVTTLFSKTTISPENCVAFVCGPPIMFRFVIKELKERGFEDEQIVSTLERYMKCGVGKCGHCCISHKYVCVDGPVFTYDEIKDLQEEV